MRTARFLPLACLVLLSAARWTLALPEGYPELDSVDAKLMERVRAALPEKVIPDGSELPEAERWLEKAEEAGAVGREVLLIRKTLEERKEGSSSRTARTTSGSALYGPGGDERRPAAHRVP